MERKIDPSRLFRVWCNPKFTNEEVCAILLVSESQLRRLAARYKLPKRNFVQRAGAERNDEPEKEELEALERRKVECREAHMRQRLEECPRNTESKVSKWRHGGGQRGL